MVTVENAVVTVENAVVTVENAVVTIVAAATEYFPDMPEPRYLH